MFARTIALFLVAITLGGCVSIKETTTRNNDGTTTTERSVNGWAASPYVAPRVYAPAPSYGRDHYGSRLSYDPVPPVPYVTYGNMLSGTLREAIVDRVYRRMCDIRRNAPNSCLRPEFAYEWAIPSDRPRR